jgi:hypothetical protein
MNRWTLLPLPPQHAERDGDPTYAAQFDIDDAGTEFVLAFIRSVQDESALRSTVTRSLATAWGPTRATPPMMQTFMSTP